MTDRYTVITPVGGSPDMVFTAIRNFPTEKIVLVARPEQFKAIEEIRASINKFKIPVESEMIRGEVMEGMFRVFAKIKEKEPESKILVNISAGDGLSSCAALSAAFVNGLKAFAVTGDKPMMLPVLKFSYYKLLSEKKMEILRVLRRDADCCASLDELSHRTKMSLPLLSYHINGNQRSQGLKELGLVEAIERTRGRVQVMLTELGKLLVEGYVTHVPEKNIPD